MKDNTIPLKLYRRRIIPSECILLKNDEILKQTTDLIITRWNTLKPKQLLHHGCSCYFLKQGFKVSKFYQADNTLLYWYCDIVDYSFQEADNTLIMTDLLADVIIYPNGTIQVVDLDELADALKKEFITQAQIIDSLHKLNQLLTLIYNNHFNQLQAELNHMGL